MSCQLTYMPGKNISRKIGYFNTTSNTYRPNYRCELKQTPSLFPFYDDKWCKKGVRKKCIVRPPKERNQFRNQKPKKNRSLKRLANIKANPKISLLVDNYDDDWQELKWVRVDGTAILLENTDESRAVFESVISTLRDKYPQYQTMDLSRGPLIRITINAIASWQAYRK